MWLYCYCAGLVSLGLFTVTCLLVIGYLSILLLCCIKFVVFGCCLVAVMFVCVGGCLLVVMIASCVVGICVALLRWLVWFCLRV